MPTTTLKAHYDGKNIVLDEPFALTPETPLAVAVLSNADPEAALEREALVALGAQSLARAYGDDELEYTIADLRR